MSSFSYVRYSGNGSTVNYTFSFPYISRDHIKVRLDGTPTTNFTFLNDNTVTLGVAPASGVVIEIRRETPKDTPIVDFTDGSVLLERDLDLLTLYNQYVAQETDDDLADSIRQDSLGVWQAQDKRIAGVAAPVNPKDAVNKQWAETAMPSQLAQATSQATAAGNSATNASNSATAAATSASQASTSASSAAGSATTATGAASTATSQATIATTQASNSAASATSAGNSATAAAGSATAAANSASAAALSESNAAASAVSAASSASSAAALLDNFDDRYLGPKASAPTADNDGDPLIQGALYFDTTTGKMRVYTSSGWIDASSASVATLAQFQFNATGGQTTFSGAAAVGGTLSYTVGAVLVSLNGVLLESGSEFTATDGSSIVLSQGAAAGDELNVYAFGNFLVADTYSRSEADAKFLAITDADFVSDTGISNITAGAGQGAGLEIAGNGNTPGTTSLFVGQGSDGTAYVQQRDNKDLAFGTNNTVRARVNGNGDFQMNSGYGSVATAYACRAWVNFNGTGTVAIRASGNVSSITDNGAGDFTVNFTTAMPDANYACIATHSSTSGENDGVTYTDENSYAVASIRLFSKRDSRDSYTLVDRRHISVAIFR